MINTDKKIELLDLMRMENQRNKRKDNLSVITGASNKVLEELNYFPPMAQISALTATQAKGLGSGYMYSKGLVNDISNP